LISASVSSVYSLKPSPSRCLSSALDAANFVVQRLDQRRVRSSSTGRSAATRLRAVDVGLEVPQVGVRVAVLLAGDLAGGDLVEQFLGAVGQLQRGQLDGLGLGDDLLDVGQQLVGDRAVRLQVLGRPTGPSRGGGSR
jgi:hypothetical protein